MRQPIAVALAVALGLLTLLYLGDRSSRSSRLGDVEERLRLIEAQIGNSADLSPPVASRSAGRADPLSTPESPSRGPLDAAVTIFVFTDFQSPFSGRVQPVIDRIAESYPDDVQIVFKHRPDASHSDAELAHRFSVAAGNQGKFWEMHDKILESPRNLSRRTLLGYVRELRLDSKRLVQDLESESVAATITRDVAEAAQHGIRSTPAFVINGFKISGAQPYENFRVLIDRELSRAGAK